MVILWLSVVPACSTIEVPTEVNIDADAELRDHQLTEDEISALRSAQSLPNPQQEEALLAILNETGELTPTKLVSFATYEPTLVVPLITEIRDFDVQCLMVDTLIGHWGKKDLPTAIDLIKELHLTTLDDTLLQRSVKVLALVDPVKTLELAHEYLGRFGYVLESIVFETVAEHDPQNAIALIPAIRKRFFSYTTYNDELSIHGPLFNIGPEYAVEFGSSLSAREAESYSWALSNLFCNYESKETIDPQPFIDLKDRIVDKDATSWISYCILDEAHDKRYLTEEQFDSLYSELNDDDLKRIAGIPRSSFIGEEAR